MKKHQFIEAVVFSALFGACAIAPLYAGDARAAAQGANTVSILNDEEKSPLPGLDCKRNNNGQENCDYGLLYHALARFYLHDSADQRAGANDEIRKSLPMLGGRLKTLRSRDGDEGENSGDFHFQRANFLYRLVRLFGSNGSKRPGAMAPDNEAGIVSVFGDWARSHCRMEDADPRGVWRVWKSENHSAQLNGGCWEAADLLRSSSQYGTMRYDDGSSANEQYSRWTSYLEEYIRQHARYGLVEYDSPTYAPYTLSNFYNYAQFSRDAELKRLSKAFLDLWWAKWAQEQINGNNGASKARAYAKTMEDGSPMGMPAWLYFGFGPKPGHPPGSAAALTNDYRPAPVIASIANDITGRGSYTVMETAPGRLSVPKRGDWFEVDPRPPGILRITYAAPGFVMGTAMMERKNWQYWANISSQNRWDGVVLAGDPGARVAAYVTAAGRGSSYNAIWGVQGGGAQILQALPPPFSKNAGEMHVWFGQTLKRSEHNGWVFVDGSAFVAVKPVTGGYHWGGEAGNEMVLDETDSPVVIQAATKADFRDLASFQAAVFRAALKADDDIVDYSGVKRGEHIRLYARSGRLPEVEGAPINLAPRYTVASPFVTVDPQSGRAHIQKGAESLDLQF